MTGVEAKVIAFSVLGPLHVVADDEPIDLGAPMLRKVLAVLLCRGGAGADVDALADAVWRGSPPASYRKTVQIYVRRLRVNLGDSGRIRLSNAGYSLVIEPGELDADRFSALVLAARDARDAGDLGAASARFAEGLEMWRGDAYADMTELSEVARHAERLDRKRLGVTEELCGLELQMGRHDSVIDRLSRLVGTNPYRERLHEHLMLALYQAGQRAAALEVFREVRATLAADLGVEPGPDLQRLHQVVLRGDAIEPSQNMHITSPVRPTHCPIVPHELPAQPRGFVGRVPEIAALHATAAAADRSPVIISGMAGVGKTTLAVHWAHLVADDFPDGQIYLNLAGFDERPAVRSIDALASLLRALGLPPDRAPIVEADAAALYRSIVAGRRVLIVLDNAGTADQVRPLLPGDRDGSMVLITSRNRLGSLVAREGARHVLLDVLTPEEAKRVLVECLSASRAQAEPDAAQELARLCGHLPLALRIAGANLGQHSSRSIAAYIREMRDEDRLTALAVEDDETAAVRAAFDLSYRDVSREARRVFRLLGLVPGGDVTVEAAVALSGLPRHEAKKAVAQLLGARLITQSAPGRYVVHDLLHLYARERAIMEESAIDRETAIGRLFEGYLRSVIAAASMLYPQVLRLPTVTESADAMVFETDAAAVAWLDQERVNLIAAIHHAAKFGPHKFAWLLADAMRGYLARRRQQVDWFSVAESGLDAAEAHGDARAQAALHLSAGQAYRSRCDYQKSIEHLYQARRLGRAVRWRECEATTTGNLGSVLYEIGSLTRSIDLLEGVIASMDGQDQRHLVANHYSTIGAAFREQGRLVDSMSALETVATHHRENPAPFAAGVVLENLGATLRLLGRFDQAEMRLREALQCKQRIGDMAGEACTYASIALLMCDVGRASSALEYAERSLTLSREVKDQRLESEALQAMGHVHNALGQYDAALPLYAAALACANSIGARHPALVATLGLAVALQGSGKVGEARRTALDVLEDARRGGFRIIEGDALVLLARIHLATDAREDALEHASAAVYTHRSTSCQPGEVRALAVLHEVRDTREGTRRSDGPACELAMLHAS